MGREADAVTQTVSEVVAVAGLLDDGTGDGVDRPAAGRLTRLGRPVEGVDRGLLRRRTSS